MFFKHILNMPEKVSESEIKTRRAITKYIAPYLSVSPDHDNAILNQRHGMELLDKLYFRVESAKIKQDYFSRKNDCESDLPFFDVDGRAFLATKSIRPSRCSSVPKGLSIARIACSRIKADAYIAANQNAACTGSLKAGDDHGIVKPVNDDVLCAQEVKAEESDDIASQRSSPDPVTSPILDNDQDNIESGDRDGDGPSVQDKKDASGGHLIKDYLRLLETVGLDKKTIVMEVKSNQEADWVAAYAAAATRIERIGKNELSIMLVPHRPRKGVPIDDESSITDVEWLKKRAEQLGLLYESQKLRNRVDATNGLTGSENDQKTNINLNPSPTKKFEDKNAQEPSETPRSLEISDDD